MNARVDPNSPQFNTDRKPLPEMPVNQYTQTVRSTGEKQQINTALAERLQKFYLDQNNLPREYNSIPDDIASARTLSELIKRLQDNIEKLKQAEAKAIQDKDPNALALGAMVDILKRELKFGEQRQGRFLIEQKNRDATFQRIAASGEKTSGILDRMIKKQEKADSESKRKQDFTPRDESRIPKIDKSESDTKSPNQSSIFHRALDHITTPLAALLFDPLRIAKFAGLVSIMTMGAITVAADIMQSWVHSGKFATSGVVSAVGSILGGGEGTKSMLQMLTASGTIGLSLVGAKIGAKYGAGGLIAGALVGAGLGIAAQVIGPETMTMWIQSATDSLKDFVRSVFNETYSKKELDDEADKLKNSLSILKRHTQENIQTLSNLTNQYNEAISKQNFDQAQELANKIHDLQKKNEGMKTVMDANLKRLVKLHTDMMDTQRQDILKFIGAAQSMGKELDEKTVKAFRDKQIENLKAFDAQLIESIKNANIPEEEKEKLIKQLEQKIVASKKGFLSTTIDGLGNLLGLVMDEIEKFDKEISKHLPPSAASQVDELKKGFQDSFKKPVPKEEPKPELPPPAKIDPNLKFGSLPTNQLPPLAEHLLAARYQEKMAQSGMGGSGGNVAIKGPTNVNNSTVNKSSTSNYVKISPYEVDNRMDRMIQMGWA